MAEAATAQEQSFSRAFNRNRLQSTRGGASADTSRQNYQAPQLSVAPQPSEETLQVLPKEERQRAWARALRYAQKGARGGATVAKFAGASGFAQGLNEFAGAAGGIGDHSDQPGFLHTYGSNTGGKFASNVASGLGGSAGRAAAIGGAVAGALEGEDVKGIAANSARWWLRKIAFADLLTLEPISGSIALLYLNIDFIATSFNPNPLSKFFFWEKLGLFAADLIVSLLLLILFIGLYYFVHPCEFISTLHFPLSSVIGGLFSGVAKLFGKTC